MPGRRAGGPERRRLLEPGRVPVRCGVVVVVLQPHGHRRLTSEMVLLAGQQDEALLGWAAGQQGEALLDRQGSGPAGRAARTVRR